MKIYDKEIYKKQESMRMTIIIIVVFLIGFIAGCLATSFTTTENSANETGNVEYRNEQKIN